MITDLSLVDTEDLVDQLMMRHDCGAIVLAKFKNTRERGPAAVLRRVKGDTWAVTGILEQVQFALMLNEECGDDDDEHTVAEW